MSGSDTFSVGGRRAVISIDEQIGVPDHITERVLRHAIPGIGATYNRYEYGPEKASALQQLAAKIESIINPPPAAQQQPNSIRESRIAIPIGTDKMSNDIFYWSPTPDSGTLNPHLLVVGESGSGKTYATQCICTELVRRSIPTIVFDLGQGFALSTTPNEFREFGHPVEINVGRDGININPLQIFSSERKSACVKQCRCRSVPKSETAKAAGSPVHSAGAFWGNHVLGAVAST
jgi:hypothetical protein